MTDERGWRVVDVMPTLPVDDLDRAVSYYRSIGFERQWAYPEDAPPTQVGLSLGSVNLMLGLCTDGLIQRQNLYFIMKGVASYHAMLRERLGDAVPDLVESDYRMRDFAVRDPWGHRLTFGEEC